MVDGPWFVRSIDEGAAGRYDRNLFPALSSSNFAQYICVQHVSAVSGHNTPYIHTVCLWLWLGGQCVDHTEIMVLGVIHESLERFNYGILVGKASHVVSKGEWDSLGQPEAQARLWRDLLQPVICICQVFAGLTD